MFVGYISLRLPIQYWDGFSHFENKEQSLPYLKVTSANGVQTSSLTPRMKCSPEVTIVGTRAYAPTTLHVNSMTYYMRRCNPSCKLCCTCKQTPESVMPYLFAGGTSVANATSTLQSMPPQVHQCPSFLSNHRSFLLPPLPIPCPAGVLRGIVGLRRRRPRSPPRVPPHHAGRRFGPALPGGRSPDHQRRRQTPRSFCRPRRRALLPRPRPRRGRGRVRGRERGVWRGGGRAGGGAGRAAPARGGVPRRPPPRRRRRRALRRCLAALRRAPTARPPLARLCPPPALPEASQVLPSRPSRPACGRAPSRAPTAADGGGGGGARQPFLRCRAARAGAPTPSAPQLPSAPSPPPSTHHRRYNAAAATDRTGVRRGWASGATADPRGWSSCCGMWRRGGRGSPRRAPWGFCHDTPYSP
jgi:hypothetical protein